ncbi:hypothetical protein D3C86_1309570 [compost metagenome]
MARRCAIQASLHIDQAGVAVTPGKTLQRPVQIFTHRLGGELKGLAGSHQGLLLDDRERRTGRIDLAEQRLIKRQCHARSLQRTATYDSDVGRERFGCAGCQGVGKALQQRPFNGMGDKVLDLLQLTGGHRRQPGFDTHFLRVGVRRGQVAFHGPRAGLIRPQPKLMQQIGIEHDRVSLPVRAAQRTVSERKVQRTPPALHHLVLIKFDGQRHCPADCGQTEGVVFELVFKAFIAAGRHLQGSAPGNHSCQ